MKELNKISVIIPTINRADVLLDTITDLLNQSYKNYELIVVDQSEFVNHEAIALLNKSSIKTRYFKANFRGLPQARNFGLKVASNEIIVYIDDDIRCSSNFLQNHYDAHSIRNVELIAGGISEKNDKVVAVKPGSFNKWTATANRNFSSKDAGFCSHAGGGNFSIKKSVLINIGGFDEVLSIGAALYEESELALRLEKSGYKAWFEPSAHLTHLAAPMGGCRVLADWPKYTYGLGHNRSILIFRHLSPKYWLTAILRTLMLGISYCRLDKSPLPFFALIRGLKTGKKLAKNLPLNTDLSAVEFS